MNEKFTPGKWQADFNTGNIYPKGLGYAVGGAYCSPIPVSREEYEANLRLLAHSKDMYFALLKARFFVPRNSQNRTEIEDLLCEINPDFDKRSEVTDIKKFAKRVKNMRDWQKEHAEYPGENSQRYCSAQEDLIDSIVAEILQEDKS